MSLSFPYDGGWLPEVTVAIDAGLQAAEAILEFYNAQSAETYFKGDGSPVTDADLASDRIIREVISAAFPQDAFLTEEGASDTARLSNPRCWIVDPIDGTAQYVARTGLFDIMIALVVDHRPVVAVSLQPVVGRVQVAVKDAGAWEHFNSETFALKAGPPTTPPRVVTSKWYGGNESERSTAVQRIVQRLGAEPAPSMEVGYQSRAFSPDASTYDTFIGLPQSDKGSIAQEWDVACIDLITHEAGGAVTDCWGRLHQYNKRSSSIAGGILASNGSELHREVVSAVLPELPTAPPALDPYDDGIL